jgi:hypothetical protein
MWRRVRAMFRSAALCLYVFLLTASQGLAEGGAVSIPETGIEGVYSDQVVISDHRHHVLVGHVIVVTRDTDTVRALVIHHRRDGVHRLRYAEAWDSGVELPYRSTARNGIGCTHGHCRDNQVGMIFLSSAMFDRARTQGLTAHLTGPAGTIDIAAPPDLFVEAATLAAGI